MATEIATAYVSLAPSFRGGQKAIADQFDKPAEGAGKESGKKFGNSFGGAFQGLLGAGAIFGGAAVIASAFNTAMEKADLPNVFRNQFGQTEAVAAESAAIASQVYADGWGGSLAEVGSAVGEVQRQLDQLGQTGDVDDLTVSAQALADTFDEEVSGVINSAAQLVKTGLAPDMQAAMDVMAAGFQAGIDSGDDLLDTITEYSVQFQTLGLDANTAFGLLNQGLEAGARNSDLVADALKEFQIRVTDGTAEEGFKSIGLSAEEMAAAIAEGGPAATQALDETLDTLREIEDPADRNAAAFEIFGTKAEDLGESLYALDPSSAVDKLGETAGAAEDVSDAMGESTQQRVDELGRKFNEGLADALITLEPLLSAVLDILVPLLPVLIPLAVGIGIVTAATWLFNAALAANPITWIILAIVALIAIVALLVVHWETVVEFLAFAWAKIKMDAETVWNAIVEFFVTIGTAIADFFVGLWDGIVAFFAGVWDSMVGIAEGLAQGTMDAISWLGELPGRAAAWFGGLYDSAVSKLEELVAWATGVPDMILDALGDIGSLLWDVGQDLIQGFLDGVESMWNSVQDSLSGLTDMLPDWKGPEDRDKRLLRPSGRWVIGSLIDGMDDEIPQVESLLSGLTADIGTSMAPPASSLADPGIGDINTNAAFVIELDGQVLDARIRQVGRDRDRDLKRRALAGVGAH